MSKGRVQRVPPDARGDQCDRCGVALDVDELIDPRCRRCGAPADFRPQKQLALRLDALQDEVERFVAERALRWRRFIANETQGALRTRLRPRAITRHLRWGVGVPLEGWDERRLYVWFDAVIGYLSATIDWADRAGAPDAWRRWWHGEAIHRYFIGKDNIWFQAVWWPAILIGTGTGLHLPDDVVANYHLLQSGQQMSASRGHGFALDDALDEWGVDAVRHALCSVNPETADVEFAPRLVGESTRSGLLGAIANPTHRKKLCSRHVSGCRERHSTTGRAGWRTASVLPPPPLAGGLVSFEGADVDFPGGLIPAEEDASG
jgi:methionyl-tRNA synthetase